MSIRHVSHFDGRVQGLEIKSDRFDHATYVVLPGKYDVGPASRTWVMVVTHGELSVNGRRMKPFMGQPLVITAGQQVQIEAQSTAIYHCMYR